MGARMGEFMLSRRKILAAGGLGVGALASSGLLMVQASGQESKAKAGPFARPMPVAPVLKPTSSAKGYDVYRIPIKTTNAEILSGVQTPLLGYDGRFVGPTIRVRSGRRVDVTFTNELDEDANVHLHGGHNPTKDDGYPMDVIAPGKARTYRYDNDQRGATLWYHDHSHHTEADHTYRGLQGAYIIEDGAERSFGLPTGAYDVPIMLRDIQFDKDGKLVEFDDPSKRTTILANGVPQPYFKVAARKYRFRLINSANERQFQLSLSKGQLTQIGTDGGLLPAPVPLKELLFTSGERADVVIDFSAFEAGTQLLLSDATAGDVLRFDVTGEAADHSRVPATLRRLPKLPTATVHRDVDIAFNFDVPEGTNPTGVVNGKVFDEKRVDFTIKQGSTEIWTLTSSDPKGTKHSFHMHLVQFRVLERNGKPPSASEAGLKDTVSLIAGDTVKVQATFNSHLGKYTYHCHFMEHSAIGMMAQMEIVP